MLPTSIIFPGSKGVIGLDIGTNSIKMIEIEETKSMFRLKEFGIIPLPKDSIVNGSILNHDAIVNSIKQLISNLKIKTKNTVVSISGHPVIIKKISMPLTSDEELEESIRFEAEQYIPFDLEEVNIDYQILNIDEEKSDQMNVILVAAKKVMIDDYTKLLSDAGLKAMILDVDVFALENAFEMNYSIEENQNVALIDVGASTISINITKDGISTFTRDVFLGGNQITEELQKEFGISFEEAEEIKTGKELDSPEFQGGKDVLKQGCDNIASEIQKSLDFYSSSSYEGINKIYLSGGTAKIPYLRDVIEEKANIPTEIIDCIRNIKYDENTFDPEYIKDITPLASVGVGLALRRLGD
ncbi:MAG: type IV pilus assembly protein PilM [Candidatus Heimdallarchaeota archaeon]